jgi:hypothetical protein
MRRGGFMRSPGGGPDQMGEPCAVGPDHDVGLHVQPGRERDPRGQRHAGQAAPRRRARQGVIQQPAGRRLPPPLPPVLTGHVSSLPPVLTGHVSSLPRTDSSFPEGGRWARDSGSCNDLGPRPRPTRGAQRATRWAGAWQGRAWARPELFLKRELVVVGLVQHHLAPLAEVSAPLERPQRLHHLLVVADHPPDLARLRAGARARHSASVCVCVCVVRLCACAKKRRMPGGGATRCKQRSGRRRSCARAT